MQDTNLIGVISMLKEPENLRHSTFKKALVLAKLESGLTQAEISERSGLNQASVARYFSEHDDYTPSPALLPSLCRALRNTILIDWLNAQVEDMRLKDEAVTSIQQVITNSLQIGKRTGRLMKLTEEIIADGKVDQDEARTLQGIHLAEAERQQKLAESYEKLAKGEVVDNGKN